jgi:hypothetical protein
MKLFSFKKSKRDLIFYKEYEHSGTYSNDIRYKETEKDDLLN